MSKLFVTYCYVVVATVWLLKEVAKVHSLLPKCSNTFCLINVRTDTSASIKKTLAFMKPHFFELGQGMNRLALKSYSISWNSSGGDQKGAIIANWPIASMAGLAKHARLLS